MKLENVIFYTIDKSIRSYRVFAQKRLREHGYSITIDQWLILKVLMENPGIMQQEVAEMVFKDNASITRIINLLVKSNYLKKTVNPKDKRKSNLKVTRAGEKTIMEVEKIILENREIALKGISAEDMEVANRVLNQIIENSQSSKK